VTAVKRRDGGRTLDQNANMRVDQGVAVRALRRALDTGDLALIRTAAAELPQINLDDALRIS
jgi:hypothetical protein